MPSIATQPSSATSSAHPADTQQFAIVPLPPLGTPFYDAITSSAIAVGTLPAITADIRRLAASVSALARRLDRMERERTPLREDPP
jgi:hypothetical protein